jgi:hypothetical protein
LKIVERFAFGAVEWQSKQQTIFNGVHFPLMLILIATASSHRERGRFCGTNIKSCRETAIFPSVYLIEFVVAVNGAGTGEKVPLRGRAEERGNKSHY